MTLKSIVSRSWWLLTRLPTARMYWKQHGLRALLVESFDLLVRRPQQESIANANRWKADGAFSRIESETSARPLAKPFMLIIANFSLPQCRKYRVLQKIEQLQRSHGIDVAISSQDDIPRGFDLMQLATSVLFYRVPDGELFQAYLSEARRLGISACYDIDDPIFSRPILESNANLKTLSQHEANNILDDAASYLNAMQQCDICTVSTPGMVAAARKAIYVPVYLWRNAIDDQTSQIADSLLSQASNKPPGVFKLAYMSGSRAHDNDFASVDKAIAEVLSRNENVTLEIMGHASIPPALARHKGRIHIRDYASYRYYFQSLAEADAVIIPLLVDPFNECKSAVRLLEASAVATPCVVSRVGDFVNIAKHGETAMIADTIESWVQAIEALIKDENLRNQIGRNSRKQLSRKYGSTAIAESLDPAVLTTLRGTTG